MNEAQVIDISGLGSDELSASVAKGIASGEYTPCTESCPDGSREAMAAIWDESGQSAEWAKEQIDYVADLRQQLQDILGPDHAQEVFVIWLKKMENSRSEKEADRELEKFDLYVKSLK